MVDTLDLKSNDRKIVRVRVSLPALYFNLGGIKMSLLCRLKNLVHKDLLKKEDLDRIVIIPKEQEIKVIQMREATPEERKSIAKYVNNMSTLTGVSFDNLEQGSCDDCISRAELLKRSWTDYPDGFPIEVVTVDDIKALPPVTPKPKTDVLDKIRAEIEALRFGQPLRKCVVDECLSIIDKYMAESEENK